MGKNENCTCFNHWGTAAYLKFLVNLIFQPDLKLKVAVETCLLLHSTQGWHTAETRNSLHLPPPTLLLKAFIKPWVNTQLLFGEVVCFHLCRVKEHHTLFSVLPSLLPFWFNFHYLICHPACYSHSIGSHGILAIVSILISFSVGGSMDIKKQGVICFLLPVDHGAAGRSHLQWQLLPHPCRLYVVGLCYTFSTLISRQRN